MKMGIINTDSKRARLHNARVPQEFPARTHTAHKSTVAKLSPTGQHISHLPMKTHFVAANHVWFYCE